MYDIILSGVIAGLTVIVGAYVIFRISWPSIKKELFSALFSQELLENTLQMAVNNEKLQRFLFEAGGLIGNGAKAGIGLQGGKGKLNLQDLAVNLIGSFVQSKLPSTAIANPTSQQALNSKTDQIGYE